MCVRAEHGTIAAAPIGESGWAIAVAGEVDTDTAREAVIDACKATRDLLLQHAGINQPSLTSLSVVMQRELSHAMERVLRRLGCSWATLAADRRRRRLLGRLGRMCRGAWGPDIDAWLASICAASGLARPDRLLGAGSWGAAYRLGDGRVMKLTRDACEARAAACLAGLTGTHLAHVDEVWQYTAQDRPIEFYAIVRDEVPSAGSLQGQARRLADLVCHVLLYAPRLGWRASVLRASALPAARSDPQTWVSAQREARGIRDELQARGIQFGDFHTGNFGLNNGHLCLFDLSLSRAPERPMPLRPLPEQIGRPSNTVKKSV